MGDFFRAFKELDESQKRGQKLLEATMAINEGRAEAFPPAIEAGFYGPIGGISRSAQRAASETFADSLFRTYEARMKGKKKKTPLTHEVNEGLQRIREGE